MKLYLKQKKKKIRQLEPNAINWEDWYYIMKTHPIKFKTAKELSTKTVTSELVLETKKSRKKLNDIFAWTYLVWVIGTGQDF